MTDDYHDLIALPHPTSRRHPRMPRAARAAQFSPFAALTGYEDAVEETARRTGERRTLTKEEEDALNAVLDDLLAHPAARPTLRVTYFLPDARKEGGETVIHRGRLRALDTGTHCLRFYDGVCVPIDDLYEVVLLKEEQP